MQKKRVPDCSGRLPFKRSLALILTVLMLFSLPVPVQAEEDADMLIRICKTVSYAQRRMNWETAIPQQKMSFSRYIFIGDSRTVGMQMSVPWNEEDCWSCQESMGYDWMVSAGVPAVEQEITENTAVFILLGINDLGNVNNYIGYINGKAPEWEARGAEVFYVAIGPVGQTTVTNAQIESFNATVRNNIAAPYIDLYSAMMQTGFSTQDGLHYTAGTYSFIYNYLKEQADIWAESL